MTTQANLHAVCTLTETLCALPAVATLDWCDRAAQAFAELAKAEGNTSAAATVVLASLAADGSLSEIESTGVGVAGLSMRESALAELRCRLDRASELGTAVPGVNFDNGMVVKATVNTTLASPMPNLEGMHGAAALVGIVSVSTSDASRVMIVSVVPTGTMTPEMMDSVAFSMRALLPVLSRRAIVAIGPSRSQRGGWISPREQMVLEQLILGKSVRQIADDLGRSPHTVHDHVKALHKKLNASSRGELVARALGYLSECSAIRHSKPGSEIEAGSTATATAAKPMMAQPARRVA
jgi:DNA-binding CsgD family transcriptional regulator